MTPPRKSNSTFQHAETRRAFLNLLVLLIAISFCFLLIRIKSVLAFCSTVAAVLGPVLTGLILAYLLNPIATFLERRLRKPLSKLIRHETRCRQAARTISSFFTVTLALLFVALLGMLIVPEVGNSLNKLIQDLPDQVDTLTARATSFLESDSKLGVLFGRSLDYIAEPLQAWINDGVFANADVLVGYLTSGILGAFNLAYNTLVGVIIAVYLLIGKERFQRQGAMLLYAAIKPHRAEWILKRMRGANKTFSTAILGKIVDSMIIGLLCFIGMLILDLPYPYLIAVIVGVTNVIPFFGPFIGAIPCGILILIQNPMQAVYFAVFILALQQLDCNVIDPKIVGNSIGLPAFWSIFACLLGAGLFGFLGMLIGVPTFAVFYNLTKELVADRLRSRHLEPEILEKLGIDPLESEVPFFEDESAPQLSEIDQAVPKSEATSQ